MSISKFRTTAGRVAAVAAAGVLGALGFGAIPAGAATGDAVTLTIQNGDFVASLCGMDNLEGRCTYDVPRGELETFTVRPGAGEPVQARVVVSRGGSDYVWTVPDGDRVCFEVGGSSDSPVLTEVTCV